MNLLQLTPGAGAMYCGNCLRDNALVATLRGMGHEVLMVPLYLPLTLDEHDQSANTPIFFGGINVFLEQKASLFRNSPKWFHDMLSARPLLRWAAGKAAKTRADEAGELTLSMLRGQDGNQARELDDLLRWLKQQPRPDAICLSNVLLLGMAHRLRSELQAPLVGMLQGEDSFLNSLPDSCREACWQAVAGCAREVDCFVAPSRYFADLMTRRLKLNPERVQVVYNGIDLRGYDDATPKAPALAPGASPVLGYFARMCAEKGLGMLVDAYITLRKRGVALQLKVGGSCGPTDQLYVDQQREKLQAAGFLNNVSFFPNLTRSGKIEFLNSVSVFSVPAGYGEAFGLYVIEALAAGVPVVQPRTAAFPETVELTGGGLLCEPNDPEALGRAIESLIKDPAKAQLLGNQGRLAVRARFSAEAMARAMLEVFAGVTKTVPLPGRTGHAPSFP